MCVCELLSRVQLFVTPRTVAHQTTLPTEFSRQEHWSGLPFPSPTITICHLKNICLKRLKIIIPHFYTHADPQSEGESCRKEQDVSSLWQEQASRKRRQPVPTVLSSSQAQAHLSHLLLKLF